MANTPQFVATPKLYQVQISTANANRDGTGTIGTVATAGSSGTWIDYVYYVATVTTTAGAVRLFIDDGTNVRFLTEVIVPAITVSASVSPASAVIPLPGGFIVLPNGWELQAATEKAEAINVFAAGGDF